MYCKNCGEKISSSDKFCTNCGCSVKENIDIDSNSTVDNNVKKDDSNVSLVFGIIAIFTVWMPIICIPLAILSIMLSKKNSGGKVLGIVSLIISIIYIVVIIAVTFFVFVIAEDDYYDDYEYDIEEKYNDEFKDSTFKVDDGSIIYFEGSLIYSWYKNDNDHSNNYEYGSYSVYKGIDAVNYIYDNYDISKSEQYKDIGNDIDNYYLIIFDGYYKDENGKINNSSKKVYYGFYYESDKCLVMKDVNTGDKVNFTIIDKEDKDII